MNYYRSPLEGYYEDQETHSSYGPARYSPYAERSPGSMSRGSMDQRRLPQRNVSNQSYGRGYSEPSTSEHRPKYSDQFKQPSYPKELSDLMGALECRLCAVEVPSPIVAKMHYSGKQHAKKVKRFLMEHSLRTGCPMPELNEPSLSQYKPTVLSNYCELCDVTSLSESDKVLHYTGVKHRKNAEDPANAKKRQRAYETIDLSGRFGIGKSFSNNSSELEVYNEGKNNKTHEEFVCELCDVKAVSHVQLESHLSGKKHKDKLEKKNALVPKPERPFQCTLCEISLETCKLFKLHLAGKRHLKTVSKVEARNREAHCEVCDLKFTSFEQYQIHTKGKKHEKKCRQNFNSAIQEVKEEKVSVVCKFCPYVGNLDNHQCDYSLAHNNCMDIKNEFVCEPCHNMVFDSEEQLNEHKTSRRHFHCVLNLESGDKIIEDLKHLYCFLCKKQYRNVKEYTEHLFEQTHMTLSSETLNIDSKTDLFRCTVCDILMDSQTAEEHKNDRKHLKLALEKDTMNSLSELANIEVNTTNFFCTNCKVNSPNFLSYSTHVLGNEHMDRMISEKLRYS